MWVLNHFTCSQEPEGESLGISCSDIHLLAQSKSKHIPEKFCLRGSLTEAYLASLSGTILEHSDQITQTHEAILTGSEKGVGNSSFVAGSRNDRAKIFQSPAKEKELMAREAGCGQNKQGSFVKYNHDSRIWKTAQLSLLEDLELSLETWPKWGSMQNGECFHVRMSVEFTCENESGLLLPTLGANEGKGSSKKRFLNSPDYRGAKMSEALRTCESDPIYLNPLFAESVMMWPLGWTDLKPLETGKCHCAQPQHGEYCKNSFDCWKKKFMR